MRKSVQRERQFTHAYENSQRPETLQVRFRRLRYELHHPGPPDRPQAAALGRETLHLHCLQGQVYEVKHPQNSHEETHRGETLQM